MEEAHRLWLDMFSSREELERVCMRNLLSSSEERVYFKDLQSRFLLVSAGWLEAEGEGRSLAEVVGKTDFDMFSRAHADDAFDDEQHIIRTGEPLVAKVERETFHDRPDAWVSTTKLPLRDSDGRIVGTFGISRDVTAQIEAQAALAYQALHDPVTGLANRVALMDRVGQALVALERQPGRIALLFVDLDDFKAINDTLGHDTGDRVLAEVGRRLARVARRTDTVARFGGDEFVVLCTALSEEDDLQLIGDRILRALRTPLEDGCEIAVTGSLGAASTSDPAMDASLLLQQADFAMYAAKRGGRNRLEVYDAAAHGRIAATRGLAADLRHAIAESELSVVFQPLFRLDDGLLTGVEALARWTHPERGAIPPSEFIPLAEQHGLIAELDAFVLDEACRQLAAWTSSDPSWEQATMAVNLSGDQLRDPRLVGRVTAALRRHQIEPARLCLEITETAMIGELGHANRVIGALSAHGVRIALDDFGTGYSTLVHLQQLHADILKIDRSFVAHLGRDVRDREIIAAVTAMAHALGMTVVGEGIENDTARTELIAVGCDEGQGYLLARPLPAADIAALWAATPHAPASSTASALAARKTASS
jgi:diguanylate cyclase (GGDEF)-like protein/PAS domain S-box-containing protein